MITKTRLLVLGFVISALSVAILVVLYSLSVFLGMAVNAAVSICVPLAVGFEAIEESRVSLGWSIWSLVGMWLLWPISPLLAAVRVVKDDVFWSGSN